MSKNSWTFVSTDEDFNGPRILREAEAAGLQVVRVIRNGEVMWFAKQEYIRRMNRVGVFAHLLGWAARAPYVEDGNLRSALYDGPREGWLHVSQVECTPFAHPVMRDLFQRFKKETTVPLPDFHEALLRAERAEKESRTNVEGFR